MNKKKSNENNKSDEQKTSDEQKESDEQESPKINCDSNSPLLIIIIVILSCVILIIFGYYLFKRFIKKSHLNIIESNFRTSRSYNPTPISIILDKYN